MERAVGGLRGLKGDGDLEVEGDAVAGDAQWSLRVELPAGATILYKYTNSGPGGQWAPGDESQGRNRSVTIPESPQPFIIRDTFGQ